MRTCSHRDSIASLSCSSCFYHRSFNVCRLASFQEKSLHFDPAGGQTSQTRPWDSLVIDQTFLPTDGWHFLSSECKRAATSSDVLVALFTVGQEVARRKRGGGAGRGGGPYQPTARQAALLDPSNFPTFPPFFFSFSHYISFCNPLL